VEKGLIVVFSKTKLEITENQRQNFFTWVSCFQNIAVTAANRIIFYLVGSWQRIRLLALMFYPLVLTELLPVAVACRLPYLPFAFSSSAVWT